MEKISPKLEVVFLKQNALNPVSFCACGNVAVFQVDFFPESFDWKNQETWTGHWGKMACVECAKKTIDFLNQLRKKPLN